MGTVGSLCRRPQQPQCLSSAWPLSLARQRQSALRQQQPSTASAVARRQTKHIRSRRLLRHLLRQAQLALHQLHQYLYPSAQPTAVFQPFLPSILQASTNTDSRVRSTTFALPLPSYLASIARNEIHNGLLSILHLPPCCSVMATADTLSSTRTRAYPRNFVQS